MESLSASNSQDNSPFQFTYGKLQLDLQKSLDLGYRFRTISEFYKDNDMSKLNLYLRIDIDFKPSKLTSIVDILDKMNIKATFFIRLLAPEYNPSSYGMLRLVKRLRDKGHELCLHHESVDLSEITGIDLRESMFYQLQLFKAIFGFSALGVAGHGGITGLNNQDIFEVCKPEEFGLEYEAYDKNPNGIFANSYYLSDSLWYKWKSYEKGILQISDQNFSQTLDELHSNLYVLIHPDTFYEHAPYSELD